MRPWGTFVVVSRRLRGIWEETRAAFEAGRYDGDAGEVDLTAPLAAMRDGTRLYLPQELAGLAAPMAADGTPRRAPARTRFEVTGECTLAAAVRLAGTGAGRGLAALNFASARNPGGGVLRGAQAQEESLARSSGLYDSLIRCPEFYAYHRQGRSLLYSDRVIYSPSVPVFRDDRGGWLPTAVPVAVLTSAAPNRRMIERNQPEEAAAIVEVLHRRARAVLAVAADQQITHLVLGAWGCGVFGNRPPEVATVFAAHLHGEFADAFEHVTFAILDRDDAVRAEFASRFPAP